MLKSQFYLIAAGVAAIVVVGAAVVVVATGNDDSSDESSGIAVDTSLKMPEDTLLRIYGNVNGDEYINEEDSTLLSDIINGNADQTYYSDVNQDGYINSSDLEYLNGIMNNESTRLYYQNYNYDTKSVAVPIGDMTVVYYQVLEAVALLGDLDNVVATDQYSCVDKASQFPGMSADNLGVKSEITAEDLMSAGAKTIITGSATYHLPDIEEQLPSDYDVVRLCNGASGTEIVWHVVTLGYILDSDYGYDYLEFYNKVLNLVESRVSTVSSSDVVKGISMYFDSETKFKIHCENSGSYEVLEFAGAENQAEGYYEKYNTLYYYPDSAEDVYGIEKDQGLDTIVFTKKSTIIGSNETTFMDDFYNYMYSSGLYKLEAYTSGNAIAICYNLTNSTPLMLGALVEASLLYPDKFTDVNVSDYLQEYYDNFTVMDFDVTEDAYFYCTSQDLIDNGYDLTYGES